MPSPLQCVCAVVALGWVVGCAGHDGQESEPNVGVVQQASTGPLVASPNPCQYVPGTPGVYGCSTTLTATTNPGTYGIWVQGGSGPFVQADCFTGTSRTFVTGPWIVPGQDATFSLRSMSTCAWPPANTGTEIASLVVRAATRRIWASGSTTVPAGPNRYRVLVPIGSYYGATTIEWWADPSTSSQVWVSSRHPYTRAWGDYELVACTDQASGSVNFPLVTNDWDLRFSLRQTSSTGCSAPAPGGPEVANVLVDGGSSYLEATPARCSAAPGGTCTTTLDWGTNVLGVTPQIWEYDGTSYKKLACPTAAKPTRNLTDGKTYTYELHLPTSCGASQASTVTVASTTARALSSVAVPTGDGLKLAGQPFAATGMNGYDLWEYGWGSTSYLGPDCSQYAAEIASIQTAVNNGVKVFRMPLSRYGAADMSLWFTNQPAYLQKLDCMANTVRDAGAKLVGTFLWNACTFVDRYEGALGPMMDINQVNGARWDLFNFAQTVAARYANHEGILGWELANELSLLADIAFSSEKSPCLAPHVGSSSDDFSTDQLAGFLASFASVVREADGNHFISSGNSTPRSAAAHLQAWPVWLQSVPNGQCLPLPDSWCPDDFDMLASNVQTVNPDPIDMVSMHFYNELKVYNQILGVVGPYSPDALLHYKRAANRANKPIFIGEFMDDFNNFPEDPSRPFGRGVLGALLDVRIPLSAAWVWDSPRLAGSIFPGQDPLTDELIGMVPFMNYFLSTTTRSIDGRPPNSGFESSSGGQPDSWTVVGSTGSSVSMVSETFNGQAVRLSTPPGGQLRIESALVPFGVNAPAAGALAGRVSARIDSTIPDAQLCVYGYTNLAGTGTPKIGCAVLTDPGEFKVTFAGVAAPSVKSARVRLIANGGGSATFDDVGLSLLY